MRVVSLLFCLAWLSSQCDANAVNTLEWSKSYTLKAVLTVPSANLSEPYQVWVNGDTYRSRVDFYGGLDKLYRQWNEIDKAFDYFKIHPDRTGKTDKEVCDKLSSTAEETRMYALNSYLPIKPWTYVRAEELNNIEAQKFVYEHSIKISKDITAKIVYAVWVVFNKNFKNGTAAVPLRFVYDMKVENRTLYNFRHDYTYFDDSKPHVQTLLMPLGMQCYNLNETLPHGTNDFLATYIDPTIDDVRRAFDESRQNKSLMTVKLYLNRDGRIKQKYQIMPEFLRSHTISNANENTFHWSSKSYTLKAVLTVPAANISEPYQVWIDGDTGKSRVDFYGGMDKLYREYDMETEEYRYFKINPISNYNFESKEECYEVDAKSSEVRTYAANSYLPVKRWTYVGNENLNNVETKKFVYEYSIQVNGNTGGKVVYTVWVKIKKPAGTAVPVRYVYELISGTKVLDNFRHDYSYFDDSKPDATILEKPPGMKCKLLNVESFNQPIDPLVEYIEPNLEYSRLERAFDRFKTKHNKVYKNEDEYFKRMNIFMDNLRFINSFNRQHRSFTVGVNHLADLSKEEMAMFLGTISKNNNVEEGSGDYDGDDDDENDINSLTSVNGKFDWRDYGAVSAVKDQTPFCGGCYAFTTAAAIESSAYVARGCKNLDEVSEQAIIDCSWGETSDNGNLGCRGGTYEFALKWVKTYGASLKSEYGPYLAMEGRCHAGEMNKLVRINDYHHLQSKKRIIKDILRKNGPLLASIDSNHQSFLLYSSGVYNEPACSNNPNDRSHGVTIIGYGKENGEEYWIIKNSFGEAWGENGYMRIAMQRNQCGIKNYVYTVIFAKNKSKNCKSLK